MLNRKTPPASQSAIFSLILSILRLFDLQSLFFILIDELTLSHQFAALPVRESLRQDLHIPTSFLGSCSSE